MNKKLSRTTKYLILICVFLITVNISLALVLTHQSDSALRTLIENRMLDISNTAAAMLDGEVLESIEARDVNTPEYQSVLKTLSIFQNNMNLSYIYCIRDLGGGQFAFLIDPDDDPGLFGEPIAYTDALYQASLGTPAVDKEPYEDRWGRFYSAYTPVFDSHGRVGGIVGVDFSAEWYEQQLANQFRATVLVSAISLFFAIAIIVLIATDFRKQFHNMLNEMNEVSVGIETLVHEVSPCAKSLQTEEGTEELSHDSVEELGIRLRSLEDQLSKQIAFVQSQAYVDGLTGLGNRSAYEEHVKRLDDEVRCGMGSFSIALFDMNGLKELNDQYGHDKGDQAILAVAAALRQVYGDAKLYRIGGDEFIAVSEQPDAALPARFGSLDALLTESGLASVAKGFAQYEPINDGAFRAVFNRADLGMYNDKKAYYQSHTDRRNQSLSDAPRSNVGDLDRERTGGKNAETS